MGRSLTDLREAVSVGAIGFDDEQPMGRAFRRAFGRSLQEMRHADGA